MGAHTHKKTSDAAWSFARGARFAARGPSACDHIRGLERRVLWHERVSAVLRRAMHRLLQHALRHQIRHRLRQVMRNSRGHRMRCLLLLLQRARQAGVVRRVHRRQHRRRRHRGGWSVGCMGRGSECDTADGATDGAKLRCIDGRSDGKPAESDEGTGAAGAANIRTYCSVVAGAPIGCAPIEVAMGIVRWRRWLTGLPGVVSSPSCGSWWSVGCGVVE